MVEKLTPPTMQLVEGKFVPAQELSLIHAERAFRRGVEKGDTNPRIVQMKLRGQLIPHWYYRSKEWVDQPYYKPSEFLQPYVGPADQANPVLYGAGTFEVDDEMTNMCRVKYGG